MLRYLLDTNLCIRVLRDRPASLRERFNAEADGMCISTIVLTELLHGAAKSAQPVTVEWRHGRRRHVFGAVGGRLRGYSRRSGGGSGALAGRFVGVFWESDGTLEGAFGRAAGRSTALRQDQAIELLSFSIDQCLYRPSSRTPVPPPPHAFLRGRRSGEGAPVGAPSVHNEKEPICVALCDVCLGVVKYCADSKKSIMGTSQDRVSKLEHCDDALVSTLRRHIRALGGELRLMVEFPDRPSMAIDLHGHKPVAKSVRPIGSV